MVFNATFNNISAILWRSVLLVEETEIPGENHRSVASHWQTLSHDDVSIWQWKGLLRWYKKIIWIFTLCYTVHKMILLYREGSWFNLNALIFNKIKDKQTSFAVLTWTVIYCSFHIHYPVCRIMGNVSTEILKLKSSQWKERFEEGFMPLNQYPCNRKISRTRHHGIGVIIMLEFNQSRIFFKWFI